MPSAATPIPPNSKRPAVIAADVHLLEIGQHQGGLAASRALGLRRGCAGRLRLLRERARGHRQDGGQQCQQRHKAADSSQ